GKGVGRAVLGREADALEAAVGDVLGVLAKHRRCEAHQSGGQHFLSVGGFQLDGVVDELNNPLLKPGRPNFRVFRLDAVDEIDAEVEVDRLIPQDVLKL